MGGNSLYFGIMGRVIINVENLNLGRIGVKIDGGRREGGVRRSC